LGELEEAGGWFVPGIVARLVPIGLRMPHEESYIFLRIDVGKNGAAVRQSHAKKVTIRVTVAPETNY
jgi:hypothetical protein